ncbi:ATP-binding protein [Streptomyces sp. TRM 70361]|uniref:AAA family ATPase n=1 Tax=Streptomyces sp. TRM 70361 TaxID=3116553 RepID=UPI002E7BD6F1|nr:ATP-binding protein [Streptomyces sp. TRM 70361]MEE1938288.1 ATP-binding protein [Streptomyces sp. TRM 70361]
MLLRFQVENHASLRDEQELSLIADDRHDERAERAVPRSRHRTVPVAAVYGPNASGKSNVIDAIAWMRAAVLGSFRRWDPAGGVPRRSFSLRTDSAAHPSSFGIEFALDSIRYEYGFTVNDRQVLEEWLYSHSGGKPRRLYERRSGEPVRFGRGLTGRRRTIEELLRPNSLYLSVAAAQGHELLGAIFRWFREGLAVATDYDFQKRLDYTVEMCLSERAKGGAQPMMGLLRFADLGVGGLEIQELDREHKEEQDRVLAALRDVLGERVMVHESLGDRVRVEHRTPEGAFTLGLGEESSGTRTWIGLLGPVLAALAGGTALCVDELDARLHPHLADALVGMFQSPEVNTRGAQLVFSTHETALLGRNARTELFRDQVWFTEKDRSGATNITSMIEFKVRDSCENLEKRYLVGRYGAVPFFDGDLLREIVEELAQGSDGAAGERGPQQEEGDSSGAEEVPHLL